MSLPRLHHAPNGLQRPLLQLLPLVLLSVFVVVLVQTLTGQRAGGRAGGVASFRRIQQFGSAAGSGPAPRRAIVTFLVDDTFAAGALTMAHSLRQLGSALPLVLLAPEGAPLSPAVQGALGQAGWRLRRFPAIAAPPGTRPKYIRNFNKLALWRLTEFDMVLYLDADGLVVRPVEPCFEAFEHARRACASAHAPAQRANSSAPRSCGAALAAAPDLFWPGQAPRFNAGALVLKPNSSMFLDLVAKVETAQYDRLYAEQGLLNKVFNHSWGALPGECNLLVSRSHRDNATWARQLPIVRFLHFANQNPRVMADDLVLNNDSTEIVATKAGEQATPSDALWVRAWHETRQAMRLPATNETG